MHDVFCYLFSSSIIDNWRRREAGYVEKGVGWAYMKRIDYRQVQGVVGWAYIERIDYREAQSDSLSYYCRARGVKSNVFVSCW